MNYISLVNICRSESACSQKKRRLPGSTNAFAFGILKKCCHRKEQKNTQRSVMFLVLPRGLEPILRRYNHNKYWTQCNTGVSGGNIVRYLMSESEYWSSRKEQKNTQRSVLFLVLPRGLEPRTH